MTGHDAKHIAGELWRARRTGETIRLLSPQPSEAEAYSIQDALIAARPDSPAGWKAGATAAGAPEALGLSEPMAGPLWEDYIYTAGSGRSIPIWPAHRAQAEVELAFRLSSTPRSAEWQAIEDAISGVAIAIELTGWRFDEPASPPGPHFVADHATNSCVICGAFHTHWRELDMSRLKASLAIDGQPVANGRSDFVMGDPRNAVAWLCGHLSRRGHTLAPGQIIMSGAIIPVTAFSLGSRLTAECEPLGVLEAEIREAS